ncbi:secreted RxLR effector protein 161-like [Lathyrus oleraceus]|uniref:secreted RxLR effector protein 161-like n=1 Tax=Pisum sativum TaxID=3888 RepID=UPI0021D2B068|nr:secreted RxLR effector protein 161-like [Pisum sativum]
MVQHFVRQMQSEFEMSLVGELTYFLGLQVKQMDANIFISQSKYAKSIVKKFGMENASHKRTPAPTHLKLTKDEKGVYERYQSEPKKSHITQVKRILKYINGTSDYGMLYYHNANSMLIGYCDADWAGSADNRKRNFGGCFFLGNNLISWFNKKQNCVSLSTTKAEYIAAESNCSQLIWMKQMLEEYNVQ